MYKVSKVLVNLFGSTQAVPFFPFIIFGNTKYKIKGQDQRKILSVIQPGDLILRKYSGVINNLFIPGFYSHVAMVVDNETIIHATTDGVKTEDILTYLRTDYISIIRVSDDEEKRKRAIEFAYDKLNKEYDFEWDNSEEFYYCTELVWKAWEFELGQIYGEKIPPDDLFKLKVEKIYVK